MLPFIVTRYVNKVLGELPGYDGSISGVGIYLFRGAYSINDLKIFKIEGNDTVPFIDFPVTDLSVEWRALLQGAIVGEVVIKKPELNFIGGDGDSIKSTSHNQTGVEVDWVEFIKKLISLKINRMEIVQGLFSFMTLQNQRSAYTLTALMCWLLTLTTQSKTRILSPPRSAPLLPQ
jgi:hypothetical protein